MAERKESILWGIGLGLGGAGCCQQMAEPEDPREKANMVSPGPVNPGCTKGEGQGHLNGQEQRKMVKTWSHH